MGVQRNLAQRSPAGLLKLESKLKQEWNDILFQEEILWMQKSRVSWLHLGDKNTKFFDTTTIIRRRRNQIESLQDGDGTWISDQTKIKEMVSKLYSKLLISDPEALGTFSMVLFPPKLLRLSNYWAKSLGMTRYKRHYGG